MKLLIKVIMRDIVWRSLKPFLWIAAVLIGLFLAMELSKYTGITLIYLLGIDADSLTEKELTSNGIVFLMFIAINVLYIRKFIPTAKINYRTAVMTKYWSNLEFTDDDGVITDFDKVPDGEYLVVENDGDEKPDSNVFKVSGFLKNNLRDMTNFIIKKEAGKRYLCTPLGGKKAFILKKTPKIEEYVRTKVSWWMFSPWLGESHVMLSMDFEDKIDAFMKENEEC